MQVRPTCRPRGPLTVAQVTLRPTLPLPSSTVASRKPQAHRQRQQMLRFPSGSVSETNPHLLPGAREAGESQV